MKGTLQDIVSILGLKLLKHCVHKNVCLMDLYGFTWRSASILVQISITN